MTIDGIIYRALQLWYKESPSDRDLHAFLHGLPLGTE